MSISYVCWIDLWSILLCSDYDPISRQVVIESESQMAHVTAFSIDGKYCILFDRIFCICINEAIAVPWNETELDNSAIQKLT